MPHVVVKLVSGKSEQQKIELTDRIAKDVMDILRYGDDAVSVAIEEVAPADWTGKVYVPDIQQKWNTLYKKPGYTP